MPILARLTSLVVSLSLSALAYADSPCEDALKADVPSLAGTHLSDSNLQLPSRMTNPLGIKYVWHDYSPTVMVLPAQSTLTEPTGAQIFNFGATAAAPALTPDGVHPIPSNRQSRPWLLAPTLTHDSVTKLMDAMRADLKDRNMEREIHMIGLEKLTGPVRLFRGPIGGTYILASSPTPSRFRVDSRTGKEKKPDPGQLWLVSFLGGYRQDPPSGFRGNGVFAVTDAVDLPLDFDFESMLFNDDRIMLVPKIDRYETNSENKKKALTLKYLVGSKVFLERRDAWSWLNDWTTQMTAPTLDNYRRTHFLPLQELAAVQTNVGLFDMFTESAIAELDGRLFGLFNKGGFSLLRVVDSATGDLLFEQPLRGRERTDLIFSDPRGNAHTVPAGVETVVRAPNRAGYAREGVKYMLVLTDGTLVTIHQPISTR